MPKKSTKKKGSIEPTITPKKSSPAKRGKKSTKAKPKVVAEEKENLCEFPIQFDLTKMNIVQNVKLIEVLDALEKTEMQLLKDLKLPSFKELKKDWFKETLLTLKHIPHESDYLRAQLAILKIRINIMNTIKEYLEKLAPMSDEEYVKELIVLMEEKKLGWVDINSIPPNICKLLYEWACKNKKLNRAGWAFPLKDCAEKGGCKYEDGCECTIKEESTPIIPKKKNEWIDF